MKSLGLARKSLHLGVSHFLNLKSGQSSSVWACVNGANSQSVSLLEADEIIVNPFKIGRLADLGCERPFGKGKSWHNPASHAFPLSSLRLSRESVTV
jgi:hypothetical protein